MACTLRIRLALLPIASFLRVALLPLSLSSHITVARRFNAAARAFVTVHCTAGKRYRHGSRANGGIREKKKNELIEELICGGLNNDVNNISVNKYGTVCLKSCVD